MTEGNLWAQQADNRRKSAWLIAGFIAFFAWLGFGGDWAYYLMTVHAAPDAYHHLVPWFGIATTLAAAATCWYAWTRGSARVLWATGAREVSDPATDQEKILVNVVEEMAIAAGLPRPRIWIVPDPDPNAFATGHDTASASIAVTQGLLDALSRDELQAVVAHEMAHIQNLDVRLMTLLAAIVGAVALISQGTGRWLGFGGGRGSRSQGEGKGVGPLALVVLAVWIVSLILAPLVTRFLAMAVSRKRELLADATGAQFTRNPMALASALEKLDAASAPTRAIASGAAHLCIVDPAGSALNDREGAVADLFGSHPPIRVRITRLKGMGYQQMKQEGVAAPGRGAA